MKREGFSSRLGFILVSAGCAIGIGNVWKFPFLAGQNGGGLFVIIYLLFLLIIGVPILTMELAVGRVSGKSIYQAYRNLEKPGAKWHLHGRIANLGCIVLMMYYTTVSGWMLNYAFKFASGQFQHLKTQQVDAVFNKMLLSPSEMMIAMAITVIAGFVICSFGLQNGVEKMTKVMMALLLSIIVILALHSFTLKGGQAGFKFYLMPNIRNVEKAGGLGHVIMAAMSQAFFTLSVGMGSMEIFGSYMSKDQTLLSESITIASLDTFVAIMSGLIIFPACFAFGVAPDSGPSLIFVTLPRVFINMKFGQIWGTLFFVFMTFASFTTVMAVFENIIASFMDNFNWTRKKATVISGVTIFVLSLPCVLGYNVLSWITVGSKNILDMEDFLVSNFILPMMDVTLFPLCLACFDYYCVYSRINRLRSLFC